LNVEYILVLQVNRVIQNTVEGTALNRAFWFR